MSDSQSSLNATIALAFIFVFRMLGLFMILPVFAVYAQTLTGTSPGLLGLALGIYGLTQGLFQLPFGAISDRLGRKQVIAAGLVVFIIGSIIAALSSSIEGVILGRALQGIGAVGSTIMALVADLTRVEHRTRAMAILGVSIGFTFTLAMILGPLLNAWISVPGIFWLTALMGAISLLILYIAVPTPATKNLIREPFTVCLQTVFKEANLWKLNFGIFCLHAILTASFVAIPILLADQLHIPSQHQWYIYLGVLIVSFVLMMAFISIGERRGYYRGLQLGAIGGLVLAELLLWALPTSLFSLLICMTLFFTAFNLLEASLPSLVSKLVPMERRGMAMGVYSSCQFLGIFAGGSLAGWVFGMWKMDGVLLLAAGIGCIWLLAALWMPAVKQDNEQKLTQ